MGVKYNALFFFNIEGKNYLNGVMNIVDHILYVSKGYYSPCIWMSFIVRPTSVSTVEKLT